MTDLEMTRLCAKAMGFTEPPEWSSFYDPLLNDAQALALVKKFRLTISPSIPSDETFAWAVELGDESAHSDDLNRAIVEFVARMQKAKCAR
jgi:hypothetical protein